MSKHRTVETFFPNGVQHFQNDPGRELEVTYGVALQVVKEAAHRKPIRIKQSDDDSPEPDPASEIEQMMRHIFQVVDAIREHERGAR